jgi:PBP1b-binding outer membrane lipoprotein LpoB
MTRIFTSLSLLIAGSFSLLAIAGCQTSAPADYGRTTTVPTDQRQSYERGLASKDLTAATDDMVRSIAAKPEIRDSPYRVQIVMADVVNNTSMPARNFDIYLARIRALLNQTDSRYNIGFVTEKARIEQLRRSEGLDPAGGSSYASKADYALQGEFYDLPNQGSNYYLLTFQIVDLNDAEIYWENSYEVKFD